MAGGDVWFFDRVAPFYHLFMPSAKRAILEAGLDHATRPVDRVIDLGGGTGRAAVAIGSFDPVVMDASLAMLKRVPGDLSPVQASATRLPMVDKAVDAIVVVDAFHHLPSHDDVIDEMIRVLRPGGVVVIRDFDPTTIRGRAVETMEHLITMRSRFVSAPELSDRLDRAGLESSVIESGFAYTVVGLKPGAK